MYARSTTVIGKPDKIDAGIAMVREEIQPAIGEMDGCVGVSMLVDRTSGRCIVTTSWESEQAMSKSAEGVRSMRAKAAELLGGEAQVQEWEVAVMHRDHAAPEGAWCRVNWIQMDPGAIDRNLERYRSEVLPRIEAMKGFCSASMMVDRATGMACGTGTFESREALQASADEGRRLRERAAERMGAEFVDVAELELAIHHLRVPELV